MADVLKQREKGEERKYEMDQEMKFKAEVRRNKLLGRWLAGEFGMGPAEIEAYAKEVAVADLDEPGIEDVIAKIMADIAGKGVGITEDQVREKIEELDSVAFAQIRAEQKA